MITIHTELYSSKNSRQIFRTKSGRTIIAKSNVAKAQEKVLDKVLAVNLSSWLQLSKGKEYPLRVSLKIFRKTHRRFDYVNIVQNLLDSMVNAGWLPDDNADYIIPIFEPYEVDKDDPRVEIKIL